MTKTRTKRKKRAVTLIEMIVVMLLIAMITGALAYNYNASLNEGKAFKTKEGMSRIKTIISLAMADEGLSPDTAQGSWQELVRKSPLVANVDSLLKDGWGGEYTVTITQDSDVEVTSAKYNEYRNKHGRNNH